MAGSAATTVEAYLAELPPERRAIVSSVRDLVNRHLPPGYSETMGWGMICWGIPLARYPHTYNGQPLCYAALAAQKNAYSLHLMSVYAESMEENSLRKAYEKAGKKLDMGKCCLRFKSLDGLLMDEVARIVAGMSVEEYIAHYERAHPAARKRIGSEAAASKSVGAANSARTKDSSSAKRATRAKKSASATKATSLKKSAGTKATSVAKGPSGKGRSRGPA